MSDDRAATAPPELLAIHGVGPAIARRLAAAGLGTVQELAEASPQHIVELAAQWPFRPDRARAQRWVDEARRLVRAEPTGDVSSEAAGSERALLPPPRVRTTFTVEVQTTRTGTRTTLATRIVDVETQAFDTWSGWDPERLAGFVAARSGIGRTPAQTSTRTSAQPSDAPEAVRAFGVLEAPVVVRGGRRWQAILHVGAGDTSDIPDGGAVEWDLAVGPVEARASERLARHRAELHARSALVTAADVVIPDHHDRARVVAVVRILGPGDQPPLARALADSWLELVAEPSPQRRSGSL